MIFLREPTVSPAFGRFDIKTHGITETPNYVFNKVSIKLNFIIFRPTTRYWSRKSGHMKVLLE